MLQSVILAHIVLQDIPPSPLLLSLLLPLPPLLLLLLPPLQPLLLLLLPDEGPDVEEM